MSIRPALLSDLETVIYITHTTIKAIYPHYYPNGAVDFFIDHHSRENICDDITNKRTYLYTDDKNNIAGTVTIKHNEICRLFVLPEYQGRGYGRELLGFAESSIAKDYTEIVLDASLPAKLIYIKRGYEACEYHMIETNGGDYLCYDVMKKRL